MINKEFICIVCPKGCSIRVEGPRKEELTVEGNECPRGEIYGKQEIINPRRNISSTVDVHGGFIKLAPVKTDKEIPKEKIFDCMQEIDKVEVDAPVEMGQIIIKNVCQTGANIVATRDIKKVE